MASSGLLSIITLPNGSSYDLRDNKAGHYLGTSTTAITEGAIGSSEITIGGTDYYLNPTSGQTGLRDQDIVTYNGLIYLASITVSNGTASGSWVKLTSAATVTDVKIDNATILDGTVAKIATTGTISGETTYNASSNPLATQSYVDTKTAELPQAMIFRGTIGNSSATIQTKTLPTAGSGTVGDVYQVVEDGNYTVASETTKAAKNGDLFVCAQGGTSQVPTYEWVLIPSGNEHDGTVTSIAAGVGLTTADNSPITSSGTIKANLTSETALTGDGVTSVGVDSDGKLAVDIRVVDGTYNASTNKVATQSTVTNAIAALDGGTIGNPGTGKTITALSQTDGNVSATFSDISITVSQVSDVTATTTIHNPTKATVVTNMDVAAASSTAATGALEYFTYENETLTLKQLVKTTGDSITTSDISNVVIKTSSGT